jgi:hypothetical protein
MTDFPHPDPRFQPLYLFAYLLIRCLHDGCAAKRGHSNVGVGKGRWRDWVRVEFDDCALTLSKKMPTFHI